MSTDFKQKLAQKCGNGNGIVPKTENRQKPKRGDSKASCIVSFRIIMPLGRIHFTFSPRFFLLWVFGSLCFYHKVSVCFGLWEFFVCVA